MEDLLGTRKWKELSVSSVRVGNVSVSIRQGVRNAQGIGKPDNEIWDYVLRKPETQDMLKRGRSPIEIKQYLGLKLSLKEAGEAKRQKKLKALEPITKQLKSGWEAVKYPFKRVPEVYKQETAQGLESMGQAFKDPGWSSLYKAPIGAAQYAFAPLTAVSRTGGETLVERPAKAAGVPDKAAEFLGDMGEVAIDMMAPGGVLKGIGKVPKVGPMKGGLRARTP